MKPVHVLVTGAAGFSGSRIVEALLLGGYRVTAAVARDPGRLARLQSHSERLSVISGDLAGAIDLPDDIDAVVHAAARSQVPPASADRLVHDNVLATQRLVRHAAAVGVRRFIYLSSLSVYGRLSGPVVDETTPIVDPDDYGLSKLIGERLLNDVRDSMPSISIRLPGVIGPGSQRNWITTVMEAARDGREIRYFNPDAMFNNAAHVEDLARFVESLLATEWRSAQRVTIAAAGEIRVRDAVALLVEAFGSRSRASPLPEPRAPFIVSSDLAVRSFGYRPTQIDAMLQQFAKENGAA